MFMNMFLIDFPAVDDDDSSATDALLMPETQIDQVLTSDRDANAKFYS